MTSDHKEVTMAKIHCKAPKLPKSGGSSMKTARGKAKGMKRKGR
jgi:hypothetical protein